MLFRKKDRRIFAWITDTHGGKRTGLLNPETVLIRAQDKGKEELWKPEPSITQRWLWTVYRDAISDLADFAGDDEIIVGHNGDITHGDRYNGCIPDITREDQRIIACDNLRPLLSLRQVKKARLMTGTEVHVPDCAEVRIAARLRNEMRLDIQSQHHARFTMNQEVVEAAHHGPYVGSRDWLKGNVAFLHLKDRVYLDRRAGLEPARCYVYGHYHWHVHVSLHEFWEQNYYHHDLVVLPAMCGLDSFIRKVGKSPPIMMAGIVALEFVSGHLNGVRPFTRVFDLRVEEML